MVVSTPPEYVKHIADLHGAELDSTGQQNSGHNPLDYLESADVLGNVKRIKSLAYTRLAINLERVRV